MYSFVAATQTSSNNSTTTTQAITISAGQNLILLAADGANQGATLTATDTLGNTYVPRKTQSDTYLGETYTLLDCLSPTPGSTTITLTTTGTTTPNPGLIVLVYTGIASFDQVVSSFAHSGWSTATNGALSTAIAPTSQPAMLLGFTIGLGGTITPDAGSNVRVNNSTWIQGEPEVIEDYTLTSTSAAQAAFTFSSATASRVIIAATYIASGSAGAALVGGTQAVADSSGSLTTGPAPFAQILLDDPNHTGGSDQVYMGTGAGTGTGDSADVAFTKLKQWAADANTMFSQLFPNRSAQTPTTGFSIAAAVKTTRLVLNPAGTLATGEITLPQNPADQQPFETMTSQAITALSVNTADGTTLNGAPTTLAANSCVKWIFEASFNTWFRQQ
jgi:hypothetical protein